MCMSFIDAKNVCTIVTKLGIGLKGHLAGDIGYVSYMWIHRVYGRDGERKEVSVFVTERTR